MIERAAKKKTVENRKTAVVEGRNTALPPYLDR